MDTLSRFDIAIDSLRVDNQQFDCTIDDDFFAALDETEIEKGSLNVAIDTQKMAKSVELHIVIDGSVTIPCDRCLDDMQQPIHVDECLMVKFDDAADDDENTIVVTDDMRSINLAWNLYEYIALAIPIMHTHAEGDCNADMMQKYKEHAIDENTERKGTDPRWDALKNISNNN